MYFVYELKALIQIRYPRKYSLKINSNIARAMELGGDENNLIQVPAVLFCLKLTFVNKVKGPFLGPAVK